MNSKENNFPTVRSITAILVLSVVLSPGLAIAKEWEWTVAPYIWASDVGADMTVDGEPALGVTVPFSDLVDKLDTALMAHLEGRNGDYGFYLDMFIISLSDTSVTPIGPGGPILGDLTVNTRLDLNIYDVGAMRRWGSRESGSAVFDLMVGARVIDSDITLSGTLPGPGMTPFSASIGPSETDMMIGGRLTGNFTPKWHWRLKGDFSFGGTEGTVNGLASIGYAFGQTGLFSLDLGYRYMSIDVTGTTPGGGVADTELTMSGPVIGFIFDF